MGGNFQQHQGVEFNNPDGTPVYAIGSGTVVYAGPAEQGALTVTIRHDTSVDANGKRYRIFSTYYHNSALTVKVGRKVAKGTLIARVGNTGRATNDHLHLEISASPSDSIGASRGFAAALPAVHHQSRALDRAAARHRHRRGAGVRRQPEPRCRRRGSTASPSGIRWTRRISFAETYGDKAHPHPLYGEHFAVSDVPPGTYVVGTEIGGKKVFRQVVVEEGKLTWVVFKP